MLAAGSRIGPYEIESLLGAGGMGEVYRARDTTLDRGVALKLLPEEFVRDADRLIRFEREAKTLATLNHPHIAQIHGLESADGVRAIVMELVEGEDLATRLARGPMPLDEALPLARQIAEALEAAHGAGVVHRDLKPANIKVRPDGVVKVLDFGLAKPTSATGATGATRAATITSPAGITIGGMILGTAAYMSPEQARGRAVDKRTDIWAFGCVLYEMLTGVRLFDAEDVTDAIAAIVRAEPDWRKLPADTPAAIRRLLHRALEKDPKERLPDIAMARIEINDALAPPASDVAVGSVASRHPHARLAWTIAALSAAIAVGVAAWSFRRPAVEPQLMRLEIMPPAGFSPESLALSADGRQLAFVAPVDGAPRVWVRRLDQTTAQPVAGTDGAMFPFWAPDGRALGFFAGGKLVRIDLSGGSPQVLANAPVGRGASWSHEGVIVFAPSTSGGLMRVPAGGGASEDATTLSADQRTHRWPQFLPDGRRFIFFAPGDVNRGLYLGSLDGKEPVQLVADTSSAGYVVPGYLMFDREGMLYAGPFDANLERLTGDAVPLMLQTFTSGTAARAMSTASTGLIAYVQGSFGHRQLVWMNRAGTIVGNVGAPDETGLANPELSPDGQRVAVTRLTQAPTVWLIDVARGVPIRMTHGEGNYTGPLWSPDSQRVLFRSMQAGIQDLFVKPADGVREAYVVKVGASITTPTDWSPDGRVLLYSVPGDDVMAFDFETQKSVPFAQTPANEGWGQFSPDGRFVAYLSNESGRFEVYVRTFPGAEGKWRVSLAGGAQPRWRPDGTELYYLAPDNQLMAVPLKPGKTDRTLEIAAPVPLFRANLVPAGATGVLTLMSGAKQQYAVAADGRFLMNVPVDNAAAPQPISIVVNWPALLKK